MEPSRKKCPQGYDKENIDEQSARPEQKPRQNKKQASKETSAHQDTSSDSADSEHDPSALDDLSRREKNRISAKKSRMKKLAYYKQLNEKTATQQQQNEILKSKAAFLMEVLEKVLEELERSFTANCVDTIWLSTIFVLSEKHFQHSGKHARIISRLKHYLERATALQKTQEKV